MKGMIGHFGFLSSTIATAVVALAVLVASGVGETAAEARRVAVLRDPHGKRDETARFAPFIAALRSWGCDAEIVEPEIVLDEASAARYVYVVAYGVPSFTAAQYRGLERYVRKGGIFVMAGNACTLVDKAPQDDIGYWDSIGALCRPLVMRMPVRWELVQVARGGKERQVASVRFEAAGPLTEGIPVNRDIPLKEVSVARYKAVWDAEPVADAEFLEGGSGRFFLFTRPGRGASVSVACLLNANPHVQRLYANLFSAGAAEWLTHRPKKVEEVASVPDARKLHPKFITEDDLAIHAAEMKIPQLKAEWDEELNRAEAILAATGDITPTESKGGYFYSWEYVAYHDPDGKRFSGPASTAVYRNFDRASYFGRLYRITGDKRFGLAGKLFLLRTLREYPRLAPLYYYHSGWNTYLSMGHAGHCAGRAYDSLFDLLTDDESRFARRAMMEKIVMPTYVDWVLNDRGGPDNRGNWLGVICSGACTVCLAMKDEILEEYPEFPRYFEALKGKLNEFLNATIGVDGGCYEGVSYQGYGLGGPLRFVALQKKVTGDDWWRTLRLNDVWQFMVYTLFPDGRGHVAFGDTYVNRQYDPRMIRTLAQAYNNGYLAWLYDGENERNPYYRRDYRQTGVKPISPDDAGLPTSRLFRSVGWAILRTGWRDDDVMLAFKSAPYLEGSHGHADENSFTLWAYGERLAIDGLSPKHYDDPRLREYKTTQAHNAILVNGAGQKMKATGSWGDVATGRVISYLGSDFYDEVAGDAGATYGDVLDTYVRNIVFVKPKYFVVFDELKAAKGPARFDWLLHAVGGKEIFDVEDNVVTIRRPKAKLAVKVLEPQDVRCEISEFGETMNWQDDAWRPAKRSYVKIWPAQPSLTARFLTVLFPLHANESVPDIEALRAVQDGVWGVKVAIGQDVDTVLFAPSGKGIAMEGLRTDGTRCMVRRGNEPDLRRFAVHDATFLDVNGPRVFSCETKATAAALSEGDLTTVVITLESDAPVALHVQATPQSVALDGAKLEKEAFEYRRSCQRLTVGVPRGTHTLVVKQ